LAFRRDINSEHRVPETVTDLIAHYRKHELVPERKAFATIQANGIYLRLHVETNWGSKRLYDVRTVDVEKWLYSLNYAPGTRSKIRNIMSALFNHAMRHEWIDRNPITKVRTSSKRLRETDVLTPAEFAALIPELELREKAMVMLAGSTGLRRSELVALTWSDIDLELMRSPILCAEPLRRYQDRSQPETGSTPPVRREDACRMEGRNALPGGGRLRVSLNTVERQEAGDPRRGVDEDHSSGARQGRHQGKGDRLA
jgi:hypothetical protein